MLVRTLKQLNKQLLYEVIDYFVRQDGFVLKSQHLKELERDNSWSTDFSFDSDDIFKYQGYTVRLEIDFYDVRRCSNETFNDEEMYRDLECSVTLTFLEEIPFSEKDGKRTYNAGRISDYELFSATSKESLEDLHQQFLIEAKKFLPLIKEKKKREKEKVAV